jgi:solute carrier family 35 protein E3
MLLYLYYSRSIQFSLLILLCGVGIATVTDLQLNGLGSFLSLLAVITTCVAQIVSLAKVTFYCVACSLYQLSTYMYLGKRRMEERERERERERG